MQALSPEDASRFLEAAKTDRLGIVLSFALATGLWREEYLALKWSDLDLQAGTATVRRTLIWRKGGGWYFREPRPRAVDELYHCQYPLFEISLSTIGNRPNPD
jgi:integrase